MGKGSKALGMQQSLTGILDAGSWDIQDIHVGTIPCLGWQGMCAPAPGVQRAAELPERCGTPGAGYGCICGFLVTFLLG